MPKLPKVVPKFYWDACCWLGLINKDSAKHRELWLLWEGAKKGDCELYTSAYTYLEVVKAHAQEADPLTELESEQRVDAILEQPFVEPIQLDTEVARLARRLRRAYPTELKQRADAIHVASAAYNNVDALHTYDGSGASNRNKVLDLDGKIQCRNGKMLRICLPDADSDGPLFSGKKDLSGDSGEE